MVTRFKIDSKVLDWAISSTDLTADQVEEKIEKFLLQLCSYHVNGDLSV